ncbi:MAG: histidine phosphatase family protein [Candidatus Micrarchaeia archaeon]|jgi:broad specificity phosphatase PhoE
MSQATGKIAFVRHGLSTHNGNAADPRNLPRFQSGYKPHLTPLGEEQARRVAEFLKAHEQDREILIVSSSFTRARKTTEIIAERLFKAGRTIRHIIEDERLQERDVGELLDGKPIPRGITEREIDVLAIEKGGEPMQKVWERITHFINTLKGGAIAYEGALVIAVTHAFPIKAAVGIALGMDEKDAFQNIMIHNGSITTAEFGRGFFELMDSNMTAHLNGLPLHPLNGSQVTITANYGIAAKPEN